MSAMGSQKLDEEPVRVGIGEIPALWNHGAVFLANIDRIFYGDEDKTAHLRTNVTGFSSYGARMFPILGLLYQGQNLLLLNEKPEKAMREYFATLPGLNLPETFALQAGDGGPSGPQSGNFSKLVEYVRVHSAEILDGYVTDPELENLARATGKRLTNSFESSRTANDKILLTRQLHKEGLPSFDGGEVTPGPDLESLLARLKARGYRKAIVRSALGASGFGMAIIDFSSPPQPEALPAFLFREARVLCQGWVEVGIQGVGRILSPSVQFFSGGPERVTLFDITEQLLSRQSVHEGNIVPPPDFPLVPGNPVFDELIRQAGIVCRWVAATGYRGTGSIDFLVYDQGGRVVIKVCEVNARVTGATYPSLLARHFQPHGAWIMRNYTFEGCAHTHAFLNTLSARKLLFEPGREAGILPINVITDSGGYLRKAQILFLSPYPEDCRALSDQFPRVLPYGCVHDRD